MTSCVEFIVGSSGCVGYSDSESIAKFWPSAYRPTVEDELAVRDYRPGVGNGSLSRRSVFVAEIPAVGQERAVAPRRSNGCCWPIPEVPPA